MSASLNLVAGPSIGLIALERVMFNDKNTDNPCWLLATHAGCGGFHIFAREHETPYSQAKFDACMTAACAETVRRQVEVGIDIVSDGETSKISYATYVKGSLYRILR